MSSKGQVKLRKIWKMLDACAPGYQIREGKHKFIVMWKGRTFPDLPKGQHGKKSEIELGHVRRMIRMLGIDGKCAKKKLKQL